MTCQRFFVPPTPSDPPNLTLAFVAVVPSQSDRSIPSLVDFSLYLVLGISILKL